MQARELDVFSVCVSPKFVPLAVAELDDSTVKVCTVVAFPTGEGTPVSKAIEASMLVAAGADEIDMVMNVAAALEGDWDRVGEEITAVRAAIPGILLKVILETAALTDEQVLTAVDIAVRAGADFVKTSTGFHPAGGASEHAVTLMADRVAALLDEPDVQTVHDRRLPAQAIAGLPRTVGVKASGGVRTTADALRFVEAGATRLGTSAADAILSGTGDTSDTGGSY